MPDKGKQSGKPLLERAWLLIYSGGAPRRRPAHLRYAFVVAVVGFFAIFRLILDPILADGAVVFPVFNLAVMIAAWHGGLRSGIAATLLSGLVSFFYFISPFAGNFQSILQVTIFALTGIGIAFLAESMHAAKRAVEHAHWQTKEILESIRDGFQALDSDFRFIYVNPAAESVIDRPVRDLIGKRIWDEYPALRGTEVERQYEKVMQERVPVSFEFYYEPRERWYSIAAYPARNGGITVYFRNVSKRKQAEKEREQLIGQLQAALADVKELSGLLPICSGCKMIRDDRGYWHQVEEYIRAHSEAEFSHSLCPNCIRRFYPDFASEVQP